LWRFGDAAAVSVIASAIALSTAAGSAGGDDASGRVVRFTPQAVVAGRLLRVRV